MTATTSTDPVVAALEDPGHVVRCIILDAVKMYLEYHTVEPEVLYLTPEMEALLLAHLRRQGILDNMDKNSDGRPPQILGFFRVVYDASDFKLE